MVAKYSPETYWAVTVKVILAAPSRSAVIAALDNKLGSPSSDGMVADWGFAKDGDTRGFPREVFRDPRTDGHPEDFFALRDRVKADDGWPGPASVEQAANEESYERRFDAL